MKWLVKKEIEFFIMVPIQPCVQKEIQRLNFQPVDRQINVPELGLFLQRPKRRSTKEMSCRAIVSRKKLKAKERPSEQLKLLARNRRQLVLSQRI